MVGEFDPMLDDSVALVARLRALGKFPDFLVVKGCCHDFMQLGQYDEISRIAVEWVRTMLYM
jgi:acetyl esterase/lipase